MYTILMPVYNAEEAIEECLISILSDISSDVNIVVVDNNSSDRTIAIINKFIKKYSNVFLVHEDIQGVSNALNKGLSLIRRGWVTRMDSDDLWMPGRHQYLTNNVINTNSLKAIYGTNCTYRSSVKSKSDSRLGIPPKSVGIERWELHFYSPLVHPTVSYRAEEINKLGGYPTNFIHCEDYHLWVKCYINGFQFFNNQKATIVYTQGESQKKYSPKRNLQLLGHEAAMYRIIKHTLDSSVKLSTIQLLRHVIVTDEYTNINPKYIKLNDIENAIDLVIKLKHKILIQYEKEVGTFGQSFSSLKMKYISSSARYFIERLKCWL